MSSWLAYVLLVLINDNTYWVAQLYIENPIPNHLQNQKINGTSQVCTGFFGVLQTARGPLTMRSFMPAYNLIGFDPWVRTLLRAESNQYPGEVFFSRGVELTEFRPNVYLSRG